MQDLATSVQRESLGSHGGRAVMQWPQPQRCKCLFQVWGEEVLYFSKGEKQRYQTLKGFLSYILFAFVWHKDNSCQSPQVNPLIMSNTRYNHAVELIHCSHYTQCKAGTGSSGWLGKVQCRLQQAGFLFSPKSCQMWIQDSFCAMVVWWTHYFLEVLKV